MLSYALAAGSDGTIGIGYNFSGRLHRRIYDLFREGRTGEADELQCVSGELFHVIRETGSIFGACYYLTESMRGLNFGGLRYPLHNIGNEHRKMLDQWVAKHGDQL